MTGDLERPVLQHKGGLLPGFTRRYRITRLVHFEEFADIRDAIAREKEIKAWTRAKRVHLVESTNPHWVDLAATWASRYTSAP